MAKTSSIEKNKRRARLAKQYAGRRARLKAIARTRMPRWRSVSRHRSSSPSCRATPRKVRVRNRCEVTGRPRAYYRKLKMSRIALRELGSKGVIPGLVKSSW